MNPTTKFLLAAALAVLPGCARPALSTHRTENPNIPYEVLFTRNGCEVGRFIDFGRPVYVTICPGTGVSASQSSYTESCGKNCTHVVDRHQRQIRGDTHAAAVLALPPTPPR